MSERTIGMRLKEIRKQRGLTQEALAELVLIPKSTLSAYENDKIDINSSVLKELAAVLHTSVSRFFEDATDDIDAGLEELIRLYKGIKNSDIRKAMIGQARITASLDK